MRKKLPLPRRLFRAVILIPLLALIIPLALLAVSFWALHRCSVWLLIQLWWLPRGKDVLVIYSDSPIWRDYMKQEIMPLVSNRSLVLNWSERRRWHLWFLSVHAFRSYGHSREFNPMVLLFRPAGRTKVFGFWQAFQDQKHGYPEPLIRLRQELSAAL
jgi:hypothetical protein